MRILYVHERLGALGGAEANAVITARELKRRGHDVGLLHGPRTGRGEEKWDEVYEDRFELAGPLSSAAATRRALDEFRPDVVYVHKMADLDVIRTLSTSGLPLVRMVHDHDIYCMRSYRYFYSSREICDRAASAFCVFGCGAFIARNHNGGFPLKYVSYREKKKEIELNQQFDRMIVVSHYMREQLIKNGFDPARLEIHAPVPPPGDADLRSTFSKRNLIIFAGQIIRGKGVDVLLESLTFVKEPFECIILGDGSHKAYCEALAKKLGLSGRVFFKGFVPQEELKQFYRECSVVTLSSVWPEPIATIGLEVMRYAIPVVGFDAGGVRDWLIDGVNGYLIPWMDRKAFAHGIERLLKDKDLARAMGRRGLQLASKKYDFHTYIASLEELFARVSREKAGREAARSKDLLPV